MTSPNTSRLFDRVWEVRVATSDGKVALDLSQFDISFHVKKDLVGKNANTCDLKVFGLGKTTRAKLESTNTLVVSISAGYVDTGLTQIYKGEVGHAQSKKDKKETSVITEIMTGTSAKKIAQSRLNIAHGAGVTVADALKQISAAMGVPISNSAQVQKLLASGGTVSVHARAGAFSGKAASVMTDLCRSAGLNWSIQDGYIEITEVAQALDGVATLLSPDTGLLESPTVDNTGVLTCETLMVPNMRPGRKVQIKSPYLNGNFRITHTECEGETYGVKWGYKLHGKKL